jgi:hypothetical protein
MISLFTPPVITITKASTEHITDKGARAYVNKQLGKPLKVSRILYDNNSLSLIRQLHQY